MKMVWNESIYFFLFFGFVIAIMIGGLLVEASHNLFGYPEKSIFDYKKVKKKDLGEKIEDIISNGIKKGLKDE